MPKEIIVQTVSELLKNAGFPVSVFWAEGEPPRVCILSSQDLSRLIGRDGAVLASLEHLVRAIAARKSLLVSENSLIPDFVLDINDYRKNQINKLALEARECAQRVNSTGRAEALAPMSAFERKIVHTELAVFDSLETQSIGAEPNRRVVIKRTSI